MHVSSCNASLSSRWCRNSEQVMTSNSSAMPSFRTIAPAERNVCRRFQRCLTSMYYRRGADVVTGEPDRQAGTLGQPAQTNGHIAAAGSHIEHADGAGSFAPSAAEPAKVFERCH